MNGGCLSLLEIGQELAGAFWSLLELTEGPGILAGSCWSLLEVIGGAGTGP